MCAALQTRPVYHHLRDSIEAHVTTVFAALAVSRWIEHQTGWSIRKFIKTACHRPSRSRPDGILSPPPCSPTSGQPSTKFTAHRLHTK